MDLLVNVQDGTASVPDLLYAPGQMAKKPFGLTGLSNSGKTTLATELLKWFRNRGYSVSCVKHAHKGFDIDRPGKDSYQMRDAGAQEVFLVGDRRWVLMHEYDDQEEPTVEALIDRLAPCDLVLVEGFKESQLPQIEVYRPSTGKEPIWPSAHSVIAVACDEKIQCPLPVLDLNDPAQIATHMLCFLTSTVCDDDFTACAGKTP